MSTLPPLLAFIQTKSKSKIDSLLLLYERDNNKTLVKFLKCVKKVSRPHVLAAVLVLPQHWCT
eukprot:scaffold503_cov81-Cylindrotheca_fusiformis.AAC.3